MNGPSEIKSPDVMVDVTGLNENIQCKISPIGYFYQENIRLLIIIYKYLVLIRCT